MHFSRIVSLISILFFISSCTTPQQATEQPGYEVMGVESIERPLPNPIEIPEAYLWAVENGTRTTTGHPGENYWQNEASYTLQAKLDTLNHMIDGTAEIEYLNNSPRELNTIVMELAQNLHKEGTPKKDFTEITGGKEISSISLNGIDLAETSMQARLTTGASGYLISGTRLYIYPEERVGVGESINIGVEWTFKIPSQGASGRMGRSRGNLYMIAYWFPQIAVYDDLYGWMDDSFLGNAEFYHEFSDYELSITAPKNWLVMGTGEFLNPEETLSSSTLERYNLACESDSTVVIVDFDEVDLATATSESDSLTWHFSSERVRDVAFSATRNSRWDGTRAAVGDLNGDGNTNYTRINSFYRNPAIFWSSQAEYAQHSTTFFSEYTDIPYPWPHMTSVEGAGIIEGGMEFPMMTVIGDYNNLGGVRLYSVTAHEIAHMWIPMLISTNERRYTWIDEGHTSYNTQQANVNRYGGERFSRPNLFAPYLQIAGTDLEGEMMRWSDFHIPGPAYGVASYPKPASVLTALRGILGDETFDNAHKEFMNRWMYKHPYPWDFFNTVEDVSGRDLSWFWRSWYYETWILDQSLADVYNENGTSTVVIEDIGNVPMPVFLKLTLENGSMIDTRLDVEDWLDGRRTIDFSISTESPVIRAEIDPDAYFPDVNRRNNVWNTPKAQTN